MSDSFPQPLPQHAAVRYELLGRLGRGGMAEVHRAYDTWQDRVVAIKRVRSPDEAQVAAMVREAKALAWLRHRNIVSMTDVFFEGSVPSLVLEYVPGWDVHAVVRRSIFRPEDFATVARQAMDALAYLHAAGWVHGDVKPGNLMLERITSGEWVVKLMDFGLCCPAQESTGGASGPSRDDLGSVHFLAPERFDGQPVTQAADVYSLGAVLYYLLSGRYPVEGSSEIEVMAGHVLGRIQPLAEVAPWAAAFHDLVMAMLRTGPEERPTIGDALAALDGQPLPAVERDSPSRMS